MHGSVIDSRRETTMRSAIVANQNCTCSIDDIKLTNQATRFLRKQSRGKENDLMSNKTGIASSQTSQANASELSNALTEARRQLAAEVKMRRDVIKPLEQSLRALKNPHDNAVALYEASVALSSAR
jgi:hypothetical protein